MKTLLIDLIVLAGFSLLVTGIYLQFGLATALQIAGSGLLAFALLAAWRGKRA
ncbi:hypothetical protein [Limnobaculum zhutongyuii]|uniref:hypothetical protein n=1 Tax=Limnobaculum zhutongyuii TaxID=2498113 RepID=UPI00143D3A6A|nr:hypothetical protein [Limnobaculum zhutongyuii]